MSELQSLPTILVIDDEKNIRQSIEIVLTQENLNVVLAHDAASALRILEEQIIDVIILDIKLGDIDGLSLFKRIQANGHDIPTIFISGHASLTEAAQAVKIGGYDFVEKPFNSAKLVVVVKRCLEYSSIRERLRTMEQAKHPIQIVGDSNALKQVIDNSRKVAKTNANIFISGESGTGKELIANLIHAESARGSGPFIKVNCSAIPENLVESELFGFERGAFTGALTTKKGLFELAHRGTIFLDEVADLSLQAQAKILRVLQSGEILKLGSEKILKVDVRILSGTHKELKKAVQEGLFREDLFYRLNVVPLNIPSLRDRKEDIPLLIQFFSQQICAKNNFRMKPIDDDVLEELQRYPWPGNVRELQNVMERLLILSGPRVTLADLPEELQATNDDVPTPMNSSNSKILLKDFRDTAEREFVINTLKRNNGNISQSALELGVGRTYLHKRLSVLGIEKKDFLT